MDLINPGRYQTDVGWDEWQIALINKLNVTMGTAKVPVVYVVCPGDVDGDYEFEDNKERQMYQMPLSGESFKHDYKMVYSMLKAVKLDAWTWIQDHNKAQTDAKLGVPGKLS